MKLIGISSSATENRSSLNRAYINAFTRPGTVPVILPQFVIPNRETITQDEFNAEHADHIAELVARLDAYVISGGRDANPVTFGDTNYSSFDCDSERDMMEIALLMAFMAANKPILGVCKGHQLIGLHLGLGHFQQDVNVTGEAHTSGAEPYSFKDRQEPMHVSDVFGDLRDYLREQTGRPQLDSIRQNSLHHQAFTINATGRRPTIKNKEQYAEVFNDWRATKINQYENAYNVMILAATPLVIEAFEREAARIVCYQAHPEEAGSNGLLIQYWLSRYVL